MSARTVGVRRERLPAVERMHRRVEDGIGPVDALVADPSAEKGNRHGMTQSKGDTVMVDNTNDAQARQQSPSRVWQS